MHLAGAGLKETGAKTEDRMDRMRILKCFLSTNACKTILVVTKN